MGRKVTALDVARAAGVSPATVDRVLNDRGGVRTFKEEAVFEAAHRLGLDRSLKKRAARTLKVAVLTQAPVNPFHAGVQAEFRAANRAYADLNIRFGSFHTEANDIPRMAAMIRSLGRSHDGLIVTCPQDAVILDAVDSVAPGIPVVTCATDLPGSKRHVYVGADDLKAGRVAGELMGRFVQKGGGDIILIAGIRTMTGQQLREEGFRSVLQARFPHLNLAMVLDSRESADRVGNLIRKAIPQVTRLRGIYNASVGAREVVAALREAGRASDIVFIAHDLTENRSQLLRDGAIDAVIDQNPAHAVRTAVETMARLLKRGRNEPPLPITPIAIHTIENAD